MADHDQLVIDVHLDPDDWATELAEQTRSGLQQKPPTIPPVWFYDDTGSQLFDEITRLDEYYPTRAERAIIEATADDIARRTGVDTLIELGSGTSEKTQLLLDAFTEHGTLRGFVPFDCSEGILRSSAEATAAARPHLDVRPVVGDFHRHLGRLPTEGRRLIAFLGSTVGNLTPSQRSRFYFDVDAALNFGDAFLLGTDLVKDPARLEAAYDDHDGITAAFNLNALSVLNRELDADFDPMSFEHKAHWDDENRWIEMRLVATGAQTVVLRALGDLEVSFEPGEWLRTEISAKFTTDQVVDELWQAGLVVDEQWLDPDGDFALTLAHPYC